MRTIPTQMWDLWNSGGPAIGTNAPHGRVTVELDWYLTLNLTYDARWWQRSDNSQVETEIPNIEGINISRSIDQDAGTCNITLSNQWHYQNGLISLDDNELGQPGYFTWTRGQSVEAQTRWGHAINDWNNVLIPDALLRTYEGFGGKSKTLANAIADGNLVLTGVWLIDSVRIGTSGKLEIQCRDMAKLLIEQQIYPPLVPATEYPVKYCRWGWQDVSGALDLEVRLPTPFTAPVLQPLLQAGTTSYAGDVPEPGYKDYAYNDPGTGYWLLINDGRIYERGNKAFLGDITTDQTTNPAVRIENTVTGNGYWILKEDGVVSAFGDAVHYGNGVITNVAQGIARNSHGDGYWILDLDGTITACGTATNLGEPPTTIQIPDWWNSNAAVDICGDPIGDGYWCLDNEGTVSAFGTAQHYGDPYPNTYHGVPSRVFRRIHAHPSGGGYWVMDQIGRVYAYGTCQHYGQLAGQAYVAVSATLADQYSDFPDYMCDLIPTPSGKGYWLLGVSGGVYPFGDAIAYGGVNGPYEAFLRIEGNYCLDDKTEVLSQRGWLNCDELTTSDSVWAIDPETGKASWSIVEKVNIFDHEGPLLQTQGRFIDALSTPNHRWITSVSWQDGYRFVESKDLKQTHAIPLRPRSVELPKSPTFSDDFVELVAWYWTEGHREIQGRGLRKRGNGRITIAQSEIANPLNVKRIDALLERLYGLPGNMRETDSLWSRNRRSTGIVTFRLKTNICDDFDKVAPNKVPTPDFLNSLTEYQINLFLDVSIEADGHARANSIVFAQRSEERIRAFEMACILAGYGVSTRFNKNDMWSATVLRRDKAFVFDGNSPVKTEWVEQSTRVWCPTTEAGTWLARRNGRCYFTGNSDYSQIVKTLASWGGFWLYPDVSGGEPVVYGNIESTGAFASECLDDDMFDKHPVIDPITQLKEIVGYIVWIDEEGAFHFESPNIYQKGNFDELGAHTDFIPEIDEALQLTNYAVNYDDRSARSEIIISTTDPTEALDDTVTTRYTPTTADILRGMIKPAMWINGVFTSKREQVIMAELISLYIWLAQRQGSLTCLANPAIQINDQVRIWERVTSETYIHYVRGIDSNLDLLSGSYLMTITTHWMGDDTLWAVDLGVEPYTFSTPVGFTERPLTYRLSTSDLNGASTTPEITYDRNLATYWKVPGGNWQLLNVAKEYIEYDVTGTIDRVYVYTFGAGTVYVSVMVGSSWQGSNTISYDPINPPGDYSAGGHTPAIKYVASATLASDGPTTISLPGTYDATRVRITLSDFGVSDWGPFYYFGGIREVMVGKT